MEGLSLVIHFGSVSFLGIFMCLAPPVMFSFNMTTIYICILFMQGFRPHVFSLLSIWKMRSFGRVPSNFVHKRP